MIYRLQWANQYFQYNSTCKYYHVGSVQNNADIRFGLYCISLKVCDDDVLPKL
jgi:hypothetical protein